MLNLVTSYKDMRNIIYIFFKKSLGYEDSFHRNF